MHVYAEDKSQSVCNSVCSLLCASKRILKRQNCLHLYRLHDCVCACMQARLLEPRALGTQLHSETLNRNTRSGVLGLRAHYQEGMLYFCVCVFACACVRATPRGCGTRHTCECVRVCSAFQKSLACEFDRWIV